MEHAPGPNHPKPEPAQPWWQHLPGLVLVITEQGRPLYASPALTSLHEAHALDGDCITALTPGSGQALHDRLSRRADFQLELQWSTRRSETPVRWFSCSARWQADARQYLCLWVDITACARAREETGARAAFLRNFCNAIPVMVAHYSHPFRCEYANRHYAALYGHNEQSILGLTVGELPRIDPDDRMPTRELALPERSLVTYEQSLVDPKSGLQWLEVTVVPFFDDSGSTPGGAILNQFITQRRRAEIASRESENRLAAFMQASAEGVIFHVDGVITDANPAACHLYDGAMDKLLGRPVLELIAPEFRARASHAMASGADASHESEIFNRHGQRIPVEIIGRSMMRNGERLRMAVVRDIRDRREAQARIHELIEGLRSEKDRAEAADRAKSVFLAAASHDLRQPIHALSLFLTALRSMSQAPRLRSADLAELCQRMQASLDGLGQLLNMLLDVSRLDANAVQVEPAPTSAQRLLEELDQDFHQIAGDKGLQLHVASSRLWVDTDPTVLRRILTNLVSNAVRYTSRGRVLIGCRPRGHEVEFQVWDSGIGIPTAQREAIFEEFFQIGQTTAARHESHGLGLGLSIVKRSALLLHATLNLRSTPGRGSMFSIRVPRCSPPTDTASARLA
ncbi:MAG: PAS domain S-box protein [Hydrogenophaga sp.]|uniref:PAS domain-containing sensor histidine kinase n=1 Tax=Hydrogenophaga sp. TaxID=1904254 RepID=UPI0026391778|nr:PAS domain S-box protein [Hydrogenophaga sp.]MDM7942137.1 PAS domain S-box protein [Hydrogenophaga sp.]